MVSLLSNRTVTKTAYDESKPSESRESFFLLMKAAVLFIHPSFCKAVYGNVTSYMDWFVSFIVTKAKLPKVNSYTNRSSGGRR